MLRSLKNSIGHALKAFNLGLVRYDRLQELQRRSDVLRNPRAVARRLEFLLPPEQAAALNERLKESQSQLLQDLFVLARLNLRRRGFFVEFGATDGVALSNTYLLEKAYQWNGIVAEPCRHWHRTLRANRNCLIEESCVWKDSGSHLKFKQTDNAELSTLVEFVESDEYAKARVAGRVYEVPTISLLDLLKKYDAPREIDYLSVDTEGSEYEILRHFDFSRYTFNVITCEHNYTPTRQKIFDLLTARGYRRVFEEASLWDDWYVRT